MSLTLRAPAKVNLHLRVFPARADGFHPLRSWFRTIDLADVLSIEAPRRKERTPDRCSIQCDDPAVPTGPDNLVRRARAAFALASGWPPSKVRFRLAKRVPVGGGLGGGSSDAAAALSLSNGVEQALGPTRIDRRALLNIAAGLGSDVPFFLHHQLDGITDATCTGRGEIVEPFAPVRRHAVLLLLPDLHVSTPAVYRQFDAMPPPPDDGTPDFAAWSALPAIELLPRLRNDLEPPAFALHPELGKLRHAAEGALGRTVRMSGSGSSLFTLYDDAAEAAEGVARVAHLPVRAVPA